MLSMVNLEAWVRSIHCLGGPAGWLFCKLKRLQSKEIAQMVLAYLIVLAIFATPIVGVRVFLSRGITATSSLIVLVGLGLAIALAFRVHRKNTGDRKIPIGTEEVRTRKISLYESQGETAIYIDAEINDEGTFVLSGQDVGKAPEEFWGDSDYEYWIVINKTHKDRLRHALTNREFDVPMASWWKVMFPLFRTVFENLPIDQEKFAQFLKSEEIPFEEKFGVIENEHKDEVVMALMQRAFGNKPRADREFLEFLKLNRIPYEFDSWI